VIDTATDLNTRTEFEQWAAAGRGKDGRPSLAHRSTCDGARAIEPHDVILDLGCGSDRLSRRLARLVLEGRVAGVDLSQDMVRSASAAGAQYPNLNFLEGAADRIPCLEGAFSKLISMRLARCSFMDSRVLWCHKSEV
jgi:ubiquinone/menaquinone biosynthesis C-methylase UbiE